MALEIERRFIVKNDSWKGTAGTAYHQSYLYFEGGVLRIRIAGEQAFLTIKADWKGISNLEYEYEIPLQDAAEMMNRVCPLPPVEKVRYPVHYQNMLWVIDEFTGSNEGLVITEVEFEDENQQVAIPPWAGREVTYDKRYLNAWLYHHSYREWSSEEKETVMDVRQPEYQ